MPKKRPLGPPKMLREQLLELVRSEYYEKKSDFTISGIARRMGGSPQCFCKRLFGRQTATAAEICAAAGLIYPYGGPQPIAPVAVPTIARQPLVAPDPSDVLPPSPPYGAPLSEHLAYLEGVALPVATRRYTRGAAPPKGIGEIILAIKDLRELIAEDATKQDSGKPSAVQTYRLPDNNRGKLQRIYEKAGIPA